MPQIFNNTVSIYDNLFTPPCGSTCLITRKDSFYPSNKTWAVLNRTDSTILKRSRSGMR